jgi:hypothetical protein
MREPAARLFSEECTELGSDSLITTVIAAALILWVLMSFTAYAA